MSFNGGGVTAGAATVPDTSKILQALADMAKSNPSTGGIPAPSSSGNITNLQNAFPQNVPPSVNAAPSVQPMGQSVNMQGAANGTNPFGGMSSGPGFPQSVSSGQSGMQANPIGQGISPEALQQQVQLIQMLQAQGVPQDQLAAMLSVFMSAGAVAGAPNAASNAAQPWQAPSQSLNGNEPSRDRSGYNDQYDVRSPSGRYRSQRSRSRSPSGYRRDATPPRRRDSPVYGDYRREGGRGGRGAERDYRRRSPDRYRRSASPRRDEQKLPAPGPKSIEIDRTLPPHNIKGTSCDVFPLTQKGTMC